MLQLRRWSWLCPCWSPQESCGWRQSSTRSRRQRGSFSGHFEPIWKGHCQKNYHGVQGVNSKPQNNRLNPLICVLQTLIQPHWPPHCSKLFADSTFCVLMEWVSSAMWTGGRLSRVQRHVTPHTSHLTPHTSHLTPHTSHLTPHASHLTPHTSHLTLYSYQRYWNDAATILKDLILNGVDISESDRAHLRHACIATQVIMVISITIIIIIIIIIFIMTRPLFNQENMPSHCYFPQKPSEQGDEVNSWFPPKWNSRQKIQPSTQITPKS